MSVSPSSPARPSRHARRSRPAGYGALLLCAALILPACASGPEVQPPNPNTIAGGPTVSGPREGVYLRASFDDDPSMFIGRFVADSIEAGEIDENRGVQTSCSQYIKYKEVRAAGEFNEYYQTSQSVKASLGIDSSAAGISGTPSGQAAVGNERGSEVRVQYKLTRKLVAHIEDHDGFTQCCESAVGACSGKYIGEFWMGTGEIYQVAGRATDFGASGSAGPKAKGVAYQTDAGLEIADGWAWRRAMSFDEVYFAFRTVDAEIGGCGWADRPPRSDAGQYFVGISPPAASEDIARNYAMRHARQQVVAYLGEYIATETLSRASLQGYLDDEQVVASVAEGLAARVKDDRYCPAERINTPDGPMYQVKVLAFFPNTEVRAAASDVVKTVAEQQGATEELEQLQHELAGDN